MSRIIYVNGQYMPYANANVHAEDRGFQFGDAVYEVCEVRDGTLVDETRHMTRLARSLSELGMSPTMSKGAWAFVMRETIRRNRVRHGLVYLQVSRGAAPRDFPYPAADTPKTVVCLARSTRKAGADPKAPPKGIAVKTMPDIRWGRCDIKTVMLLPAAMAKQAAKKDGAQEAWFIDGKGMITEGASSNAWIIDASGHLVTRHADFEILRGVTRMTLIDLIAKQGLTLQERAFSLDEAKAAREAFITSASNPVTPVVRIDGQAIGDGKPGAQTLALRAQFHSQAELV